MKFLLAIVTFALYASSAHAGVSFDPTVRCLAIANSRSAGGAASSFNVCATSRFTGPSPASYGNGTTVYMGGYSSTFAIVQGLKEGTDTTALSVEATKKAYSLNITVVVRRDDYDSCEVDIVVKAKTAACKSCVYCGDEKYTVDCTGVKNGRKVTCQPGGPFSVLFPFTGAALKTTGTGGGVQPAMPPKAAAVKAPKVPTKASVRAPVRAPKKAVPIAPVKGNAVASPVKAPRAMARVAAPTK